MRTVRYAAAWAVGLVLLGGIGEARAQDESPLRIFGFFQNSYLHEQGNDEEVVNGRQVLDQDFTYNSFLAQQLNLFLQKDFRQHWTAFINLEFVNTFSSDRRWGSFSLEEAWVGYRPRVQFNLKLGLQVPPFNYLNEIKNRTPLLPYIFRPIVYEATYAAVIADEDYLPRQAFGQVYGAIPVRQLKVDYALYVGNSPNINDDDQFGPTGLDTSATLLWGGRVGLRLNDLAGIWGSELRAGFSATRDQTNQFKAASELIGLAASNDLKEVPRTRLGVDARVQVGPVSIEGEYLGVDFDEERARFRLNRDFYYLTLGVQATERLFAYVSYWDLDESATVGPEAEQLDFAIPTVGAAFDLNERVRLKAQGAYVDIRDELRVPALRGEENRIDFKQTFGVLALAVSVFF